MEPQRVSHFEILERLGSGGMGEVYRARDTLLGREVALKLIRPQLHAEPAVRARFLRECRAAAALSHPAIATLFEAGEAEDGRLYFASELVRGETLAALLARGRLAPERAVELGLALAEALAAAHEHGIVHRDIKPQNLMVTTDGRLKVLDFGLARVLDEPAAEPAGTDATRTYTATRAGTIVGTPAYMSPEQATGEPVDARSDIFSAGCVLYEMACGRLAFPGDSMHTILRRVLAEDPPSVEIVDPGLPGALGAIVRRAMAKEPTARYASAGELADALRALRAPSGLAISVRSPAGPRRFRPLLTAGSLVLLFAASIGVFWWYGRPSLAFHSRDTLLVASVDNRTDEPAFDLALRTALEADLQRSPYASVFDQGQVVDTLRLMRKDPSTPIDEALGRDLCRFAGVRALVVPRILSVGEAFELQALLVDPTTGRHVDQIRVTARGREDVLLHAIDDLASRVRERLGESLQSITEADAPVVQASTSSWEALQLHSLATTRVGEGRFQEASTLYKEALAKDPEFVGARAALSLVLIQHLGRPEEGKALLREARTRGDTLPQFERLMLEAVSAQFVDENLPAALEQYKMVSQLYPNRMEPLNNQGQILRLLGRTEEAIAAFEASAALSVAAQVPLQGLFWLHILAQRPDEAERDARQLVKLGPEIADFQHFLAWSLWGQERFDAALEVVRRVVALDPRHPYGRANLPHLALATGAAAEAETLYRALLQDSERGNLPRHANLPAQLAITLRALGRTAEAREVVAPDIARLSSLAAPTTSQVVDLALLAAAGGDVPTAEQALRRASAAPDLDAVGWFTLARVSALVGHEPEAVAALERAFRAGFWDHYFALIVPGLGSLRSRADFRSLLGLPATATETPGIAPERGRAAGPA